MNRMEVLSERVAAAHLDRRRQRELQRQERIFNTKVRTIGVDKEALQHQVEEKRAQRDSESRAVKEHSDDLIRTDRAACLLESRQKKDERLLAEAIVNFRQQFQQPSSRREFDLNDPEVLKKQEGVRVLPGLAGEDLGSEDRTRRQREQLRDWTLQQQQELDQAKELQRLQAQQYDQSRLTLDNRTLKLQKMEEEQKRATNIAIKDFNRALAVELREQRERERRQVEENNRTDILNHLQGELLSENVQRSARVRRDCYKGMTPEQIREFTNCQRQQAEEKRRAHMEQKEEQLRFSHHLLFQEDSVFQRSLTQQLHLTLQENSSSQKKGLPVRRELEDMSAKIPELTLSVTLPTSRLITTTYDSRFAKQVL